MTNGHDVPVDPRLEREVILGALRDALAFLALYKYRPEYIRPEGVDILSGKLRLAIAKAEGR